MFRKGPFTTVWIEFQTVEEAHAFYRCTGNLARLSPAYEFSVDLLIPGRCVPTAALTLLCGVAKRPQMFVLDRCDPIPFLTKDQRSPSPALAA
ncbi:MAG: hypothetical protein KW802_03350 [Candidatus Doudnabacteria bacterium]|nr:hypothetical protein [Candidatus Doudnabacteria bacterium]